MAPLVTILISFPLKIFYLHKDFNSLGINGKIWWQRINFFSVFSQNKTAVNSVLSWLVLIHTYTPRGQGAEVGGS